LLVFDVTRLETFQKIPEWMEEIRKHCKKDVKIILAANKVDLVKERAVDTHTIEVRHQTTHKYKLKFTNNVQMSLFTSLHLAVSYILFIC
jgi:small GTP-binding protein